MANQVVFACFFRRLVKAQSGAYHSYTDALALVTADKEKADKFVEGREPRVFYKEIQLDTPLVS